MNKAITTIATILLIALWLYAAGSKLMEYQNFKEQLKGVSFLRPHANVLAVGVPAIEIIATLLLVFKRSRLMGHFVSFFLMLSFVIYIFYLLHFGEYKICSCGGIINKLSLREHFWFNVGFMVIAGLGTVLLPTSKKFHQVIIAR